MALRRERGLKRVRYPLYNGVLVQEVDLALRGMDIDIDGTRVNLQAKDYFNEDMTGVTIRITLDTQTARSLSVECRYRPLQMSASYAVTPLICLLNSKNQRSEVTKSERERTIDEEKKHHLLCLVVSVAEVRFSSPSLWVIHELVVFVHIVRLSRPITGREFQDKKFFGYRVTIEKADGIGCFGG